MNAKGSIVVVSVVCALACDAQTTYYQDLSGRLMGSVTTDGNGKTGLQGRAGAHPADCDD